MKIGDKVRVLENGLHIDPGTKGVVSATHLTGEWYTWVKISDLEKCKGREPSNKLGFPFFENELELIDE